LKARTATCGRRMIESLGMDPVLFRRFHFQNTWEVDTQTQWFAQPF
jgi:hypothetical protein